MGQHKLVDSAGDRKKSVNWRPNQEHSKRSGEPILCLVCNTPSALIRVIGQKATGEEIKVRLAKSVTRVTGASVEEALYVHTTPCLGHLVQNWAAFVAEQEKGLKGLAQTAPDDVEEIHAGESQPDSTEHAGVDGKDMGSEKPLS